MSHREMIKDNLTKVLSYPNDIYNSTYKQLLDNLIDTKKIKHKFNLANEELKRNSFQFLIGYGSNNYFPNARDENYIPVDWLPKILTYDQYTYIQKGVKQRAKAFNLFLHDLYLGNSTLIPDEIIKTSNFLSIKNQSLLFKHRIYAHIYGIDMVTDQKNKIYVLEDNLGFPAGMVYPQMLRQITKQYVPELITGYNIYNNSYTDEMYRMLSSLSDIEKPVVVYLQRGPGAVDFFEARLFSQQTNIILADAEDLYFEEDGRVFLRLSNGRLKKIDVIYLRLTERFRDLYESLTKTLMGGETAVVTFKGNMLPADKAVFSYVPQLIQYYLGEEAILKQPNTLWLGDNSYRELILSNIDKFVIKSRSGVGGKQVLIGNEANIETLDIWKSKVRNAPESYIAQEIVYFSKFAKWDDQKEILMPVFSDLRMFGTIGKGNKVSVMQGGLCRFSSSTSRIVNTSSGGGVKDIWVQKDS
ncbi:circularly permuted type 2 ATP-grasp protein [Paenibacillus polymyxa]|uniref:circularly permuted type 2 ATP-grasp protein n=1 Tax=Paenibacillus polymyxa TaxID=1406 RepID=UPI0023F81F8E|nr:circularly permuted type 2 ATP-grasp protein [Paenibacillus polymyxa]